MKKIILAGFLLTISSLNFANNYDNSTLKFNELCSKYSAIKKNLGLYLSETQINKLYQNNELGLNENEWSFALEKIKEYQWKPQENIDSTLFRNYTPPSLSSKELFIVNFLRTLYDLGEENDDPEVCSDDNEEIKDVHLLLCEMGYAPSQCYVGLQKGVDEENITEKLLLDSSAQGYLLAIYELACHYERKNNKSNATLLWTKAKDLGHELSKKRLFENINGIQF